MSVADSLANMSNAELANGDMKLPFYPLWDYVLVEPIETKKTKGGLVLPDGTTQDDMGKGIIRATGPGTFRESGEWIPNPLRVGDMLYFMGRMSPFKVVLDGKLYLCMAARDCVGVANRDCMEGYIK